MIARCFRDTPSVGRLPLVLVRIGYSSCLLADVDPFIPKSLLLQSFDWQIAVQPVILSLSLQVSLSLAF